MNQAGTYHILIDGQVAQDEINLMSPLQMTLEQINPVATLFNIRTDQSGLIGLLRYLHAHGLILLAVQRED